MLHTEDSRDMDKGTEAIDVLELAHSFDLFGYCDRFCLVASTMRDWQTIYYSGSSVIIVIEIHQNMDFNKPIAQFLKVDQESFLVINALTHRSALKNIEGLSLLHQIIDTFAQNLSLPITSIKKITGTNQRLFFKIEGTKVLGFIKVGQKNLFHRNKKGEICEMQPTCVLDFYVHESVQRNGVGKVHVLVKIQIFQKFLKMQGKEPKELAYDRPSHKFIAFLKKHYNLFKYVPQNNNFVVFDDYFQAKSQKNIVILDSLSTLGKQIVKNPAKNKNKDSFELVSADNARRFEDMWEKQKQTLMSRRYSAPWAPWESYGSLGATQFRKNRMLQ